MKPAKPKIELEQGVLVAIEGIDGAGKTTQAVRLATKLRAVGIDVVLTKEPTNGKWGRRLRQSAHTGRLSPHEELEVFIRDRREHVDELIGPALERGAVVIVDRYFYSTAAYQGSRGLDVDEILRQNTDFAPLPDLLIHLDVSPRVGLSRIRLRGDEANLFEREELLERAAAIFRALEAPFLLRLKGGEPIDLLEQKILAALVDGPVFRQFCHKISYKDECEPAFCSYNMAGVCKYTSLNEQFAKLGNEAVSDVETLWE